MQRKELTLIKEVLNYTWIFVSSADKSLFLQLSDVCSNREEEKSSVLRKSAAGLPAGGSPHFTPHLEHIEHTNLQYVQYV